jgi:protein arginine kinase activator
MKCDVCKQRDATLLIRRTVNGVEGKQHLCARCAADLQGKDSLMGGFFGSGMFGNWFGTGKEWSGLPRPFVAAEEPEACPHCGLTYEQFRRSGQLGCAGCYEVFHKYLEELFTRIQRGPRYIGRSPAGAQYPPPLECRPTAPSAPADAEADKPDRTVAARIEQLQAAQRRAVAEEDYEEAARIRDELKELKEEQGGGA